jgi:hypothetical protein
MLDERYATQTKALDAAFVAAEKAVSTALSSAEKAVETAARANDKRFEEQAKLITAMGAQVAALMPRMEYDTAHKALEDRVGGVETRFSAMELRFQSRLDRGEGQQAGAQSVTGSGYEAAVADAASRASRTSQMIAIAGVVIAVVAVAVSVIIATR